MLGASRSDGRTPYIATDFLGSSASPVRATARNPGGNAAQHEPRAPRHEPRKSPADVRRRVDERDPMRPGWDGDALEEAVDPLQASAVAVDVGAPASEIRFAPDDQCAARARELHDVSAPGPECARRTRRSEVRSRPGDPVDPRARAAEDQAEGRPAPG